MDIHTVYIKGVQAWIILKYKRRLWIRYRKEVNDKKENHKPNQWGIQTRDKKRGNIDILLKGKKKIKRE